MKLDATDLAILRCLQQDGRRSLRDIGKEVGVSAPTVAARIAALERLGVLRGYGAAVDAEKLGETSAFVIIKVKPSSTEAVGRAVARLDAARRVTIGRAGRILVEATLARPRALDDLLEAIAALPDVVDLDHQVAVRTIKDAPRALLASGLGARIACFECKGPIEGEPVKIRLEGREHFFCCSSCKGLYVARYRRLKSSA